MGSGTSQNVQAAGMFNKSVPLETYSSEGSRWNLVKTGGMKMGGMKPGV